MFFELNVDSVARVMIINIEYILVFSSVYRSDIILIIIMISDPYHASEPEFPDRNLAELSGIQKSSSIASWNRNFDIPM